MSRKGLNAVGEQLRLSSDSASYIKAPTESAEEEEEEPYCIDDEVVKPNDNSLEEDNERDLNVEHLSPIQTGHYFGMLRDRSEQEQPEQVPSNPLFSNGMHMLDQLPTTRVQIVNDAVFQSVSEAGSNSAESADELSAGDSGGEDVYQRAPMPLSRATPQHYLDITTAKSSSGRHGVARRRNSKSKHSSTRSSACAPVLAASRSTVQSPIATSSGLPTGDAKGEGSAYHKEEALWMARQRLTGAVARMVCYAPGERPMDDILSLQRTPHGHLMVMAMLLDGPAAMAGVVRGDVLVSINGRRPPPRAQEDKILVSLRGPVALVFLGFVGKIQAEVQVAQPDAPSCGLPDSVNLVGTAQLSPATVIQQRETVVFREPEDALLLEASERDATEGAHPPITYELQRGDAQHVLREALGAAAVAAHHQMSRSSSSFTVVLQDKDTDVESTTSSGDLAVLNGEEQLRCGDSDEEGATDPRLAVHRPWIYGETPGQLGMGLHRNKVSGQHLRPKAPVFFI